jgi:hypothetical protein
MHHVVVAHAYPLGFLALVPIVNGQKIFISRFQHSDLLLLLARTTPYDQVANKTGGLSVFLVDIKAAGGPSKPASWR